MQNFTGIVSKCGNYVQKFVCIEIHVCVQAIRSIELQAFKMMQETNASYLELHQLIEKLF